MNDKHNRVELFHSGDLGDIVYAIPALRRLAYPAHLQLYPNPGVTRQVMDSNNAGMILPLLNAQNGVSASWVPSFSPDGLRLDFAVRRFYQNRLNLCDIHNHYVGHDHQHAEEPWLMATPEYRYPIVVARSARYRSNTFPWKELYSQFSGRACFIGVPWEHEDFQAQVGPIPYVHTPSLLDVAKLMMGADVVIANQSCPRAIAEALKVPVIVEQGHPANTHFGRRFAYYPQSAAKTECTSLRSDILEDIWCQNAAMKALSDEEGRQTTSNIPRLTQLAKITRHVRNIVNVPESVAVYWGGDVPTAKVLAYTAGRRLLIQQSGDFVNSEDDATRAMRVYDYRLCNTQSLLDPKRKYTVALTLITSPISPQQLQVLVSNMLSGGIVAITLSDSDIATLLNVLPPEYFYTKDSVPQSARIRTFRIEVKNAVHS